MHQIELDEAKTRIASLLEAALGGEEVVITQNDRPVLKLVPVSAPASAPRRSGSAKGMIDMAEDFDAPLEDFAEYAR